MYSKESSKPMVTHRFEQDEHGDVWVVWAADFDEDAAGRRLATAEEIKTFKALKENSK